MMKAALSLLACLGFLGLGASHAAEPGKPNVVVILADDVDECSERERPKTRK